MPQFYDAVEAALGILRRRGRVSCDALQRELDLDPDGLAALRRELVDVLGAARAEAGEVLVLRADAVSAPHRRGRSSAERRQLTVLACDLVGSTTLSMRLDPEDLRELMHVYQTTCTETIERHGGHVATWQGDGVFVLFGYPRAGEDDAVRAVRCAADIIDRLAPERARFEREHDIRLAVRIGIHTGTVVVGDEGTTSTWQTHAFGDTPNVAGRVAAAAQPDTVAVTEPTRRLASGYFEFASIGTPELRGVSPAHELYRLLGPGPAHTRFESRRGYALTPLVDRERERAQLAEAADRACSGRTTAVLLTGDPGIGKSRLVHDLCETTAGELRLLKCECSPYHRAHALYPLLEGLRQHWALDGDTDAQLRTLRANLGRHRELADPRNLALLAAVLELHPAAEVPAPLGSPQRQRAETLGLLAALLRAEARRTPLLLVVEDAHWIDPSTLELLSQLLGDERDAPLLLVITARPEFAPPWEAQSGFAMLTLDRLDPGEARELVRLVAPLDVLSASAVESLAEHTDGVPLFVEEMTRATLEAGASGSELAGEDVPTSLYGCLMARLDRDGPTLIVAQCGAAIGRRFGRELLGFVCELDDDTIDSRLRELVDAGLLEEVGDGERSYAFRHSLTQQVASSALLRRGRQDYHGRIADVIAERFPRVAAEQPELLARHLEDADRTAEAIGHWMRAGQRSVQSSSNAEAILYLEHALGLLERLPNEDERTRIELPLCVLAAVPLMLTRGWTAPEVEAHYRRAVELCHRVGDAPELFPSLNGLVTYLIVSGQLEEAREMGEADVVLARRHGNVEFELEAEVDLGNTLLYLGRPRETLVHLTRVDELYDPQLHHLHAFIYGRDPRAIALLHRALALWTLGRPDAALQCIAEAETLLDEWPHPFTEAWVHTGAAAVHLLRGEIADVRRQAEVAIATSTVEGFPNWLAQASVYRGWALVAGGDPGGLAEIEGGIELWNRTGAQLMVPWLQYTLADAYARCDRISDARELLDRGLEHLARTGDRWAEPELMRLNAELGLRGGVLTREEAAARVRGALTLAARRSMRSLELRAATTLIRITGADADAARLRRCHAGFDEGLTTHDLLDARSALDGAGSATPAS